MKKHRIFSKGDIVHCLLSSHNKPNVLLPVKGIVIDVLWDRVNPQYKIKIVQFYDNMKFLKKHYFDMNFKCDFENRTRRVTLKKEDFPNVESLTRRLNESDNKKFNVIVESIMCTKTKEDLRDLFGRVQLYIISKNLKEIKEISLRKFSKGIFTLDDGAEFNLRFKRGWGDRFKDSPIDIDKYLLSLD
jgi:hypothetical protein